MSNKPDLVKDTTRAFRLLGRVARGEMSFTDLIGGIGKGSEGEQRATSEDEVCTINANCTAANGHEGGCVFDAPAEDTSEATTVEGGT